MKLINIDSSQKSMRVPGKKIRELIAFVEKSEKVRFDEVDIAIVSGQKMAWCNRTYLGHAGQTDVISFDLTNTPPDPKHLVAELIVCSDVAIREAKKRKLAASNELLLYILHGLLHVIGYDDQTPADRKIMHKRQDHLLNKFLG